MFFILYFFKLLSKSIISLLFGELSNIDYFFTFLGIDSNPAYDLGLYSSILKSAISLNTNTISIFEKNASLAVFQSINRIDGFKFLNSNQI